MVNTFVQNKIFETILKRGHLTSLSPQYSNSDIPKLCSAKRLEIKIKKCDKI